MRIGGEGRLSPSLGFRKGYWSAIFGRLIRNFDENPFKKT